MSTESGMCQVCLHCQTVTSGRGTRFFLCLRHRQDARFAKYPRIPVLECPGFELAPVSPSSGD